MVDIYILCPIPHGVHGDLAWACRDANSHLIHVEWRKGGNIQVHQPSGLAAGGTQ